MTFEVDQPRCRGCGQTSLKLGLDLGLLPLANAFVSVEWVRTHTSDPKYPLRVFFCENCALIQLLDLIDRKEMFDDYAYLTATSETSVSHFSQYADQIASQIDLRDSDLVVDIGSNDGTLLKAFSRYTHSVLGVEPARNVAKLAVSSGIDTIVDYFRPEIATQIGNGRARVITANNVVSHVSELSTFLNSVSKLLGENGIFAFEVPWVVDVLRRRNFDIIYHEHLSYFGFRSLSESLSKNKLELVDVQYLPKIHGGTIRGIAAHPGMFPRRSNDVEKVFQTEVSSANFADLLVFANEVKRFRSKLLGLLRKLKRQGKRIVGYGAPAKATILLNYCSIDNSILDFVIDSTPLKQGKLIPGVRIPIRPPDEFSEANPDYALMLAWNFQDEIIRKEHKFIEAGGRFIIPFPEPSIVP